MRFKTSVAVLIVGILIAIVAAFSCRYSVQPFGEQILVVNNFTGNKEIVASDGEVTTVGASGVVKGVELHEVKADSPVMDLNCKIKWRNGKMYFSVNLDMDAEKFKAYNNEWRNPSIYAVFIDEDGFTVAERKIDLNQFVHYTESSKGRWQGSFEGSVQMRLIDFKQIDDWSPAWTAM